MANSGYLTCTGCVGRNRKPHPQDRSHNISFGMKQAGKPSAGKSHAGFEEAGAGNRPMVRLVRHSQRKRGATDRLNLRGNWRQPSTLHSVMVCSPHHIHCSGGGDKASRKWVFRAGFKRCCGGAAWRRLARQPWVGWTGRALAPQRQSVRAGRNARLGGTWAKCAPTVRHRRGPAYCAWTGALPAHWTPQCWRSSRAGP
jgi:hypothetical protein